MKRMIPVMIIIVIITALTVYSSVMIDHATKELIDILKVAHSYNCNGDYENTKKTLDDFHETLERHEFLFGLFVRRDLVCNVHITAASLYQYADEETKNDFNADVLKTIEQIEMIRRYILRPA